MIQLSTADVDDLLLEAMRHERHVHVVDGGPDRESALDAFVAAFDLPDYFGHNLDALMDSLRDVAERHDDDWVLLWRPRGVAAGAPGDEGEGGVDEGVLGVLEDLDGAYDNLTVAVG